MLPYVQLEGEWDELEKNSSPSLTKKEEEIFKMEKINGNYFELTKLSVSEQK